MFDYMTSGINFSLPGNGGSDCQNYISLPTRLAEDLLGIVLSLSALFVGLKKHKKPPVFVNTPEIDAKYTQLPPPHYPLGRMLFLISMTVAYAMEVTYKLATKQLIFVLNPCHMICVMQIILLASCPSSGPGLVTYLFRFHLSYLHGPINAVLFPVTNTLFLPGEVFTYWLEHALLLIIPFYLLWKGGRRFTVEPFMDMNWILMSFGLWGIYHFLFLEIIAMASLANLNSMLCPAISDPFYGPNWRTWAMGHQFILTLASGKLFGLMGIPEPQDTMKSKAS